MENRPEFLMAWIGIAQVGGTSALINTNLTGHPLNHSLSISGASKVILGKELLEKEIRDYGFDPFQVLNGEGLNGAAHACGFKSPESLFAGIGIGKLSTYHVLEKLLPKEKLEGKKPKEETLVKLKENLFLTQIS